MHTNNIMRWIFIWTRCKKESKRVSDPFLAAPCQTGSTYMRDEHLTVLLLKQRGVCVWPKLILQNIHLFQCRWPKKNFHHNKLLHRATDVKIHIKPEVSKHLTGSIPFSVYHWHHQRIPLQCRLLQRTSHRQDLLV